jgi:predicted nucleotidyltransferase
VDSDIDIAVVLGGDVSPTLEIDRTVGVVFDMNLKYGVLISVYPVSDAEYRNVSSPLLLSLRREGVPA